MEQQTAVEWLIDNIFQSYLDGKIYCNGLDITEEIEKAKQMEKEQMKSQTSIDLLRDKAERAWTPCHGCDDNDKNFWINGYIHGALEN